MDSLELITAKLGLTREYKGMVLSGIPEIEILDFMTLSYVEFLKKHRTDLLSAFIGSRSGDAEKDRGLIASQMASIITDWNFFHDA